MVTPIQPFSTPSREMFEDYLDHNVSRFRIAREKQRDIISWLTDSFWSISSRHGAGQRHHF